jgi:hypothetical protein
MALEVAALPAVDIPKTYGDLGTFMTITMNGAFAQRRYQLMEDTPDVGVKHAALLAAMSSAEATNQQAALSPDIVKTATEYLLLLQGREAINPSIAARVGEGMMWMRDKIASMLPKGWVPSMK